MFESVNSQVEPGGLKILLGVLSEPSKYTGFLRSKQVNMFESVISHVEPGEFRNPVRIQRNFYQNSP